VRDRLLLIDLLIAVLVALVVLIVSPGVAVSAIIAVIVLALCGLSLGFDAWIRRRHRSARQLQRPARRR
jgi:F0F1-type ATP synthase assembly protein I